MSELNIIFTLKILIILIVAFLLITAWDEVILRLMFKYLNLERESILAWVIIGLISLLLLIFVLIVFRIEAHEAFGISETVDTILTKTTENFKNGELVHSNLEN